MPDEPPLDPAISFRSPDRECDLVLKGGVTSGLVYPPAILELAPRYRFRSIGGTSAGAIAAALTAAAEYGRDVLDGNGRDGFERLRIESREIARPDSLLALFRPSRSFEPAFRAVIHLVRSWSEASRGRSKKGPIEQAGAAMRVASPGLFAASWTAVVLLLTLLSFLVARGISPGGGLAWVGALVGLALGAWAGMWVASAVVAWRLIGGLHRTLPAEGFGLCSGMPEPRPADHTTSTPLSLWLHRAILRLAGLPEDGPALTLGELRDRRPPGGLETEAGIDVRFVSTNLSQGRPFVVPFGRRDLLFDERDFQRLFPPRVVRQLIDRAGVSDRVSLQDVPGVHFLPSDDDLPLIVAARLSLSFPLLLSAVPLYTIRTAAFGRRGIDADEPAVVRIQRDDLQRNWFSDGGISSNFPIHFFDAWLPRRPTFGINLTEAPREAFVTQVVRRESVRAAPGEMEDRSSLAPTHQVAPPEMVAATPPLATHAPSPREEVAGSTSLDSAGIDAAADAIHLPRANEAAAPLWIEVASVPEFLHSIWNTAQSYRDTMQALLPSYRERIVQIRFAPEEGGLNLTMDQPTIDTIVRKGELAGRRLHDDFQFEDHQWTRLLVLFSQLETQLLATTRGYGDRAAYERVFQHGQRSGVPYRREPAWCRESLERVGALLRFVQADLEDRHWEEGAVPTWRERELFAQGVPSPKSVLRVTPSA